MDGFDYNFAHSMSVFASASKSGEAFETRDAVLTNHHSPVAEFNLCFLKAPDYKLERTLDRIDAYQRRVRVPLRLHLNAEHEGAAPVLVARGAVPLEPVPAMSFELSQRLSVKPPALEVTTVRDEVQLAEFSALAFASFGYPVNLAAVAFTSDFLSMPHVELYMGSVAGGPVCCSMLLATGAIAGIYWVAVASAHRRRGYGAAITAHALAAAHERGLTVATLQASELGAPVYRRLGFAKLREYLRFDLPFQSAP